MIPEKFEEVGNVKFLWDDKCLREKGMQSVKHLFNSLEEDLVTPILHDLCQNKIIKELLNLRNNEELTDKSLINKCKILKELHHLVEKNKVLCYLIAGDNNNLFVLNESTVVELKFEEFQI